MSENEGGRRVRMWQRALFRRGGVRECVCDVRVRLRVLGYTGVPEGDKEGFEDRYRERIGSIG